MSSILVQALGGRFQVLPSYVFRSRDLLGTSEESDDRVVAHLSPITMLDAVG
jgi:hypothetical protein